MGLRHYIVFFFSMRTEKIDPGQKHFHFFARYLPYFDFLQGPWKLVVIQAFHPQAESVLLPVQDLQRPPPGSAEYVETPIERILSAFLPHEDRERVDLLAHIRVSGPDENVYIVPIDSHSASFTAWIIRPISSFDVAAGKIM
jgi:hypothetical protein